MTMKRRTFVGLSAALAASPFLGRGVSGAQDDDPIDASPAATPGGTPAALSADDLKVLYGPVQGNSAYRLVFMLVVPDNPFWTTLKDAVVARAAENGVTVEVIALPTTSGVAEQVSQMENAVTQQYDGIILGTVDAAGIIPGITTANAAGIPVLAVDTAPSGGEIISLVQTDNALAASRGGDVIAEAIGGAGKVLNLQGDLANLNGQLRNEGLHRSLEAFPDIEIIDQNTHWQATEALAITENILTSDPDLVAIFAANDPPALAALEVCRAQGRDDMVIVGFDGTRDGLQAVKDGGLIANILQFPDVMGIIGVDLMVRHLNGEEIPATVDSGSGVVTADNVDEYLTV